jgi:toxin YoeB
MTLAIRRVNSLKLQRFDCGSVPQRIYQLLQASLRDAFVRIGKPEPLREHLSGCWSRRIDDEHRLIDRLERATLVILACRYHYR